MTTENIMQELWKYKDVIAEEHEYNVDLLADCLETMRVNDNNLCLHAKKDVLVLHEESQEI